MTVSLNQPAYKNYIGYLPSYMSAYIHQKKTSVIEPYHLLQYESSRNLVTSQLPSVSVSFNGVPVTETLEAIRSAGGKEMKSKGQAIFLIPSPDPALLRLISNGGANKTTPAVTGSVNMSCLATLSLLRRIASNFLHTHQYPAFIDANHLEYNAIHWLSEIGAGKRKASDNLAPQTQKRARGSDGSPHIAEDDVNMPDSGPMLEDPAVDKIIYAVPPPIINLAWGDSSQIPEGDGLFIRYVADTQNGRQEGIVPRVVNQYFLGCLGTNAESVRAMFKRVKMDWGVIADTDVGKELAHIFKCIELGLLGQARVFPVVDEKQYLGCCLMGAGFQIAAYDSVYTPVDNHTLREKVGLASSHKMALDIIANLVTGHDPELELFDQVKCVEGMMELRNLLLEADLSSNIREQVCVAARGLRFSSRSLNISADNLSMVLQLIAHPENPLPMNLPIHPLYLFSGNRNHLVWSSFGELAPTFHFAGGPKVDLNQSRNLPTHISVRNVSLSDALIDLDVVIRDKAYCGSSANRRSGPFKDRVYNKLDARQILTALTAAVGVTTTSKSSGKDKPSEVDGGGLLDEGF